MFRWSLILVLAVFAAVSHGIQPSNYDQSRKRIGSSYGVPSVNYGISRNGITPNNGFGIREIWDYLIGGNYGQYYPGNYPGQYPGSGYYPGGGYPGQYPGNRPGLEGPPGAHPGCPLCDSSVYSYCAQKQLHDSCCCESVGYRPYSCRQTSCGFLYANSCDEYNLISSCCCVDLQKNAIVVPAVVA